MMIKKLTKKPLLIVISGPSGSGKTTIVKEIIKNNSNLFFSVSYTTRKKRENEEQGKDYFFVKEEEFKKMIEKQEFLEYATVHNNFYGTNLKLILHYLKKQKDVILDIDTQGALQVKKNWKYLDISPILIFIMTPTLNDLKKRLQKRGTDKTEDIKKRYEFAKKEITQIYNYNYLVINNNLQDAIDKVKAIILAERCRIPQKEELYAIKNK